ncbi:MAG: tyrosine-type recombinase/integrase, partial [Planctomycetaceae bacterium]
MHPRLVLVRLFQGGTSRRNLLAFFGSDKPLRGVTVAEARDFERYLKTSAREHRYGDSGSEEPLDAATIRKRISNAKQFFGDALERGLIEANPFAALKGANVGNAARQFFVISDMTAKILDACPDSQWRLIVALCRYGGLRCPSELVGLELTDVDWEAERIRVRSPKTEQHEGKAERIIPLFTELRSHLEVAWDEAPVGATHFITRYRDATQNLRTTFQKIDLLQVFRTGAALILDGSKGAVRCRKSERTRPVNGPHRLVGSTRKS